MKNKLIKILMLASALTVLLLLLCGCSGFESFLPPPEGSEGADTEGDGGTADTPPEEPVIPVEKVTMTYMYDGEVVTRRQVEKGQVISEAELLWKDNLINDGYGYAGWYSDERLREPFDFTAPIEADVTLYGDRGRLAGPNVSYFFDFATRTLTFSGEGPMYDCIYVDDIMWNMYKDAAETIVIEEGITTVGRNAFHSFSRISEVELPGTVSVIGEAAFYDSSITVIHFPESLRSIGVNAFMKCSGLTYLNFNHGIETISRGAFYDCPNVTEIILTNKLAECEGSAFFNASNLQTAYYVGTRAQYDEIVFYLDNYWLDKLANTYFLAEEKPEERGPYWHYNEDGDVEQWYITVGFRYRSHSEVPFLYDYVDPDVGVTSENVEFMNAIVYHGYKFDSWKVDAEGVEYKVGTILTDDIRIDGQRGSRSGKCGDNLYWSFSGYTLTIYGTGRMWDFQESNDAPWYKKNISVIKIAVGYVYIDRNFANSDVSYIGSHAFSATALMESINIPKTVDEFHPDSFGGCSALNYIYFEGNADELSAVKGLTSLNNMLNAVVYVKSDSGTPGEGSFWRDVESTDGTTRRVAWTYKDGTVTLGGDPIIPNFASVSDTPWYAALTGTTKVVIREGITTVGHNSFSGFAGVTTITLPDTVNRISASAFRGTEYCTNPANRGTDGALYIGNHLINVDPSMAGEQFEIRKGTKSIAEIAFDGCSGIKRIIVPISLYEVYSTGLNGLTGIEAVFYSGSPLSLPNVQRFGDLGVPIYCYSSSKPSTPGDWWYYEDLVGRVIGIWDLSDLEEGTEA